MEFNSDIPHSKAKNILVSNSSLLNKDIEIWNFAVKNYQIFELSNYIGVWKIKQLKK